MTTYFWEKNDGGGWVPFEGTPTAQNPTEDFAEGTWSVRATVTDGSQTGQQTRTGYVEVSGAPSYVGPLDLVPGAVVAYSSARALSAAMCGENGYTLKAVDATELAFAYNASTGLIDSAAISAWTLAHGAAGATVWNDHSGNAKNLLHAAGFTWTANQLDGNPVFDGNGANMASAGTIDFTSIAATVFFVCKGDSPRFWPSAAGDPGMNLFFGADCEMEMISGDDYVYSGFDASSLNNTTFYLFECLISQAGVTLLVNGVALDPVDPDISGTISTMSGITSIVRAAVDESVVELLAYDGLKSAGNRTTLRNEIMAFYGMA